MANAQKGEVEFVAGDETFILRFGWNEIAEVETALGITSFFEEIVPKIGRRPGAVSAREWRAMLWAAMGGSASGRTVNEVGEIMGRVEVKTIVAKMLAVIELAFPSPEAVKKNPPMAGDSAGTT